MLAAFSEAYERFHDLEGAWLKNGARRGEKDFIPHFNIPKLHTVWHLAEQNLAKGTADNFLTETIEHLHIKSKQAYPAMNKKEWEEQVIRCLTRQEKLAEFSLFQTWRLNWCQQDMVWLNKGSAHEGDVHGRQIDREHLGKHLNSIPGGGNLHSLVM